jgi:hypothetical protein
MWEVFHEGVEPYPGMTVAEVNVQVKQGYRMTPPEGMPQPVRKSFIHFLLIFFVF